MVQLRKNLRGAIRSLKNLTNVSLVFLMHLFIYDLPCHSWSIESHDEECAISTVMESLSLLPSLTDFQLSCDGLSFVLPLHLLSGLRRITVRGRHSDFNACLDKMLLSHFKSLTSFTLHISRVYMQVTDIGPLWKTFLAEGIRLEELSVDEVSIELMDFIASFSGLQRLTILRLGVESRDPSDDMAEIFFRHAIPNTLRYLNLQAIYEGRWCFSEDNAAAILGCQKLSDLSIALWWKEGNNQPSPVVG
jgi:hypothetical protein